MPMTDISGSTIALVNVSQSGSPVQTNYSYQPYGIMSVTGGTATSWPFLWHGLEEETTDPAHLYFEPSGNVYNADPFHLSLAGPQGLGGSGSGPGSIGFSNGGGGTGEVASSGIANGAALGVAGAATFSASATADTAALSTIEIPVVGEVAIAAAGIFDILDAIFNPFGGGAPQIPVYDIIHTERARHPVWCEVLGICDQIVTQGGDGTSGSLILAQAVESGDDPLLRPDVPDAEKERIAKGLRERLRSGKLKGNDKKKAEERLRKYDKAKHPSRRAHGADTADKLIPIIPEPPLARAPELGGAGSSVDEALAVLELLLEAF